MGFQTEKTISGSKVYNCPFVNCDGTAINISQLNTTAAKGANIQFLDESQGVSEFFYWYTPEAFGTDTGKCGPAGKRVPPAAGMNGVWFKQTIDWSTGKPTFEEVADKTIKFGEAFLFTTVAANKDLTFAGCVQSGSFTNKTISGINVMGNPFAAPINISTINTTAAKGAKIQFLDESQGVAEFFYWYTPEAFGTDTGKCGPAGKRVPPAAGMNGVWFKQTIDWSTGKPTFEEVADKTIKGGEGFLFSTSAANKDVIFTAPYSL